MGRSRTEKNSFSFGYDDRQLKQERQKARDLRASQWWKRQCAKGICAYCRRPTPAKEMTMDHIVPISRGGRSTKGNVTACCKDCNTKKKHLLPMEWAQYLSGLKKAAE